MKKILLSYIFILLSIVAWAHSANTNAVEFIPNEGQWKEPFLFKGLSNTVQFYVEKDGIKYILGDEKNPGKIYNYKYGLDKERPTLNYHAYKMQWIGSNEKINIYKSKKQQAYHNYYLGNDAKNWRSNVGIYHEVALQNVYNYIDFNLASDDGNLKYDFIVKPGGDINAIQFKFDGIENIKIKDGKLILTTSVGEVQEMAPYAYQYINDEKVEVPVSYVLKNGVISFKAGKSYDKNQTLVIDPVIVFATLSGSRADNWGFTATYDEFGNLFAGGIVNDIGYPTTTGAFQVQFRGGSRASMSSDIVLSKFNANGNILMYSTYLGSTSDDEPHSIVVDRNDQLIVSGKTSGSDFPIPTNGYDATANGGVDVFIVKFNAAGTQLVGGTYLGGDDDDGVNIANQFTRVLNTLSYNYGDNYRGEVNVDANNNIYVVGQTQSSNFPTTANAIKRTLSSGDLQDGFLVKFNPNLTSMTYGTLLGGSAADAAYVVNVTKNGQFIYVAGGTQSTNFLPTTVSGAYRASAQGGIADGFIVKINNSNYTIERSTYIGTSAYDQIFGIQTDDSMNVYVMGQTEGSYPVSNNIYSNANGKQFIHKLNSNLTGSIYSTVFGTGGGKPDISLVTMLVDTCENVYISGWGGFNINNFGGTNGLPITNDAAQRTTDGEDFYFIVFSKNIQNLLYASFFGAAGRSEHVDGGTSRFSPTGVIYQNMCASCGGGTAFPSTPGAYSSVNGSRNCNMGMLKIAFNLGSVETNISLTSSTTGCAPFTAVFGNNSTNAITYEWDFGDGSPTSNVATPTHIYTNPGTYTVRLIGINTNACKERDTSYLTLSVSADTMRANFDYRLIDSCVNYTVNFTNTSVAPSNNNTYRWDFGDGNTSSVANPNHNYPGPGIYTVRLISINPDACNNPDTMIKVVTINNNFVKAQIPNLDKFCTSDDVSFTNTSFNARDHFWSFGDGVNAFTSSATHKYTNPGTYVVTYVAINPNSCNLTDTLRDTITVLQAPIADFSYTPLTPELNKPTQFINQTQMGESYVWEFGDGQTSTAFEPIHNYVKTGQYEVCLTAKNSIGCADRVCKFVSALVQNVADVPTAFSPNGDGKNDRLYVRGYNIETIDFKIYNRWGQLVYESNDIEEGWDGKHNGKLVEMDAFAFQVQVRFKDGETKTLQGNVTVLL